MEERPEEAEACLNAAYEVLERQRGPQAVQTRAVRRRLTELYEVD